MDPGVEGEEGEEGGGGTLLEEEGQFSLPLWKEVVEIFPTQGRRGTSTSISFQSKGKVF